METKKEEKKHADHKKPAEEKKEAGELENLKKEIEQKNAKIEEMTDTLKRLQAEFVKYSHAGLIARILPVIDSFELALKNAGDREKFVDGMKMIYAQLYSALEAEGLRPIKASGEQFDPYKHEVLLKEESDKPEGTILEEFQKGYMLNDKVLRFSKVKISGK